MILIIDNYDSFTYNLYQIIGEIDPDIRIVKNDEVKISDIESLCPRRIIISSGSARFSDVASCKEAVKHFAGKVPILGIGLGHHIICQAFGAELGHAKSLMHGKQEKIKIDPGCPVFKGLPKVIDAAMYHSFTAAKETLPKVLEAVASSFEDEIMAVVHRECKVYGLQFHPESIMTPLGGKIMENFIGGRGND